MPDNQPEELLPCPFCGGKAYTTDREDGCGVISCPDCCAEIATYSRKIGIKMWNTRVSPAPVQVEQGSREKALEEALRYALPYLKHSLKFFKFQRPGKEFWPNREDAEANIADAEAALATPKENRT